MTGIAMSGDKQPGHQWDLLADACSIEKWRKDVTASVVELGGDSSSVEVAQLGVSELLANVVTHVADRACRLEVLRKRSGIYVRLFDRSPDVPVVMVPNWDCERGRGLWLLREMTDGLGYELTTTGKWVWFHIALPHGTQVTR